MIELFFLGLLGAGHCAGMCGPLVLAFPARAGSFTAHIAYHAGRIATYSIIGGIMAGIGAGLVNISGHADASIARIQIVFSLVAAGFLLLFGLIRLELLQEPQWMTGLTPNRIPGAKSVIRRAQQNSLPALLLTGMLMGFLPCGLSFAAFARALAADSIRQGSLMTLCFGAGTLPVLLLLGAGAGRFARKYHKHFDIIAGILMIGMAASLAFDAVHAIVL